MKTYGIYLAYPPRLELASEGLGRHLAQFLGEAAGRDDVKFVIACPSWMRQSLKQLFEEFSIQEEAFELIGPKRVPQILRLYQCYLWYVGRQRRRNRIMRFVDALAKGSRELFKRFERLFVTTRSAWLFLALTFVIFSMLPLIVAFLVLTTASQFIGTAKRIIIRRYGFRALGQYSRLFTVYSKTANTIKRKPQQSATALRLYKYLDEREANLLVKEINSRRDIKAWYAPTSFWLDFNRIVAPRLTCVPDVVLTDFPIAFSSVGGERFLNTFNAVRKTIEGGTHFVTYSSDVKFRTLVDRYHVNPSAVTVVLHGASRLDDLIYISGFGDSGDATEALCRNLLKGALNKAAGLETASYLKRGDFRFLFYASQFRPNKNVISLLRAYEHLLKNRYIGHKLILTGNPSVLPEIASFIRNRNLQNDVLCLHGLSTRELAACYRLADLAVNPSLSEGGCPFTLTEALSVGTPVVMARIPVSEEVVTDPILQQLMLFDPFDWEDIATRIDWALKNNTMLLSQQLKFYAELAQRSWREVVDEHIAILDRISTTTISAKQTI